MKRDTTGLILQAVCMFIIAVGAIIRYYRDPEANGPLAFTIICVILAAVIFVRTIYEYKKK